MTAQDIVTRIQQQLAETEQERLRTAHGTFCLAFLASSIFCAAWISRATLQFFLTAASSSASYSPFRRPSSSR